MSVFDAAIIGAGAAGIAAARRLVAAGPAWLLAVEAAKQLGVKLQPVPVSHETKVPVLASNQADMTISPLSVTPERLKVVDFVTYFSAGTSFYVKASGGPAVANLGSLCGKSVSVETGTTEQSDATAQSKKCKKAGKPKTIVVDLTDVTAIDSAACYLLRLMEAKNVMLVGGGIGIRAFLGDDKGEKQNEIR